jgi:hypothetical protein
MSGEAHGNIEEIAEVQDLGQINSQGGVPNSQDQSLPSGAAISGPAGG